MALRPIDWCTLQTILIVGAAVLLYFLTSLFPVQTAVNEDALMADYSRQPPWPLWVLTQASLTYFGGLYSAFQPPLVRMREVLSSGATVAAMDAAVRLRLSEAMANRAMTVEEIADVKQVDSHKLEMLLEVLSDAGVFQRDTLDKSRWRNNAQSVLLREEHPNSVAPAVRYEAANLKTYSTFYDVLASGGSDTAAVVTATVTASGRESVPTTLLNALCAREKDASYILTHDLTWKQYHRVVTVGGCGMLAERIRASFQPVVVVPVLDTAALTSASMSAVKQSITDKAGAVRWGDIVLVQSLSLLDDVRAEELIRELHDMCKHSGARLLVLDPLLLPDDAPSAFLNARRRRDAVQVMLYGGMLRSSTALTALLAKHSWSVDDVIATRSEFVGVLASSTGNHATST